MGFFLQGLFLNGRGRGEGLYQSGRSFLIVCCCDLSPSINMFHYFFFVVVDFFFFY